MSLYSQIDSNKRRTIFIMAFFIAFITSLAYIFGQASGYGLSWAGMALIISGIFTIGSFYWSDKLVLTISGAHPILEKDNPLLFRTVENLCIGAGLPMPKIYVINDSAPNAFATGRDSKHAVICVTAGLLEKLEKLELEGVIAHELSHVKNYDTRLMGIVAVLVGMVAFLADWFMRSLWWGGRGDREEKGNIQAIFVILGVIFAILSPFIATLIQLAISRRREFLADASGVLLTRYPEGLASALEKIAKDREVLEVATNATAHLYIVNPFKGKDFSAWFAGLFNTHPPVEERIKILRVM
ncbi:MAG: Protease HtpX [Microgenomates group bacterium LiPW_16]|nr:MAG: Protease HtpX [Microgenomates group bacterium LiPW_16]